MKSYWVVIAGLLGLSGVMAGAAGAHAVATPALAAVVEKAAYYQLTHALLLIFFAEKTGKIAYVARLCILAGIILFCGSLYYKGFGFAEHAPLAPFGGILLMLGWGMVMVSAITRQNNSA